MILSALKLLFSYMLQRLHLPFNLVKRSLQRTPNQVYRIHSRGNLLDKIPENSWDGHMHVFNPSKYPLSAEARYSPKQHLLSDALRFESSIGIRNIILVQPSSYGYDNACILDALREIGPKSARAVVAFDPNRTSLSTLQEWHRIGVRGVRVNLHSVGKTMESNELSSLLRRYADMIRPLEWMLQLYVPMSTISALEETIPQLRVKVCFDHFGQPELSCDEGKSLYSATGDPYLLPGFKSLVSLLEQGNTYVKISAPYRMSMDCSQQDLEPLVKELLSAAGGTRAIFATDWPHTRFEGLDIRPFIESVVEWCEEDEAILERVFRSNAKELYGVI